MNNDQRMAFANKIRLYSSIITIIALAIVLLLSLRILANAVGYAFTTMTSMNGVDLTDFASLLGARISALADGDQAQLSAFAVGLISIFSHLMLVYCLVKYWLKQFGFAVSAFYESAKLAMIPDEREEIRFSPEPAVISVGRQLNSRDPYDYSFDLPRTTRILIGSKSPQVLPIFRHFFEQRQGRVIAPLRALRHLLVALFAFGVVSLLLYWADGTPQVVSSYWSSAAVIALASLTGMAIVSALSSFFDNTLLRGLLANKLLGASVVAEKSAEPIPLRVSSLSLSKHLVDKLDDEPGFGKARILVDNDEGRSKSVQDTGDFSVNIIAEGEYTEQSNPIEGLGKNRLLVGSALSVLASILLALFSVPQALSGLWNGEEVSIGRVIVAPVVIAAAYAVAAAFARTGENLQVDGLRILATDWISSEITFTEFYGQVAASTGRRLDQAGMIAEEEKGQVCQTNYRAVSATVSFVSDAPGGQRVAYSFEAGDHSQFRLQAISSAIKKIASYGQPSVAKIEKPNGNPELLLEVDNDSPDDDDLDPLDEEDKRDLN